MKLSFLLAISALISVTPVVAQEPTSQPPAFSPSLRERLRRQILVLVPQLRSAGGDGSSLALPAAQVGDFDLALRLAKSPSHRDRIWQWRALQLAHVGKQGAALETARFIQNAAARADVLLVAARYATNKGQVELAQSALRAFSLLKSGPVGTFGEVEDGPRVDQVVYGGYLWARANQPEAARRLWQRAWPLLLAQAQNRQKWQGHVRPQTGEPPFGSQAYIHMEAARSLVSFMADAGMVSDILPYLQQGSFSFFRYWGDALLAAQTPDQIQILREWLVTHDGPLARDSWKTLAIVETQIGDVKKGHEDYAHGRALPLNDSEALEGDAAFSIILGELWNDDLMRSKAEESLRTSLQESHRALDAEAIIWSYRIFQQWGLETNVRANVTREELLEATDKIVAIKPARAEPRILEVIAGEWRKRGDNVQVLRVARAMVAAGQVITQRNNERRHNEPDSFWDGGAELQGANWLRDAGKQDEAQVVARQFAQNAPARFRPYAAMKLLSEGFSQTAKTLFDPIVELKRQRELKITQRVKSPLQFNDWGRFAATQACFASPDAPVRWFEILPSPQLKALTLAAWAQALSPAFPDQRPFVRYVVSEGMTANS